MQFSYRTKDGRFTKKDHWFRRPILIKIERAELERAIFSLVLILVVLFSWGVQRGVQS